MSAPRQVAPAQVRPAEPSAVPVAPAQPGPPRQVTPATIGDARAVALDGPALPPQVAAELDALRREVAELRAEVARLRTTR